MSKYKAIVDINKPNGIYRLKLDVVSPFNPLIDVYCDKTPKRVCSNDIKICTIFVTGGDFNIVPHKNILIDSLGDIYDLIKDNIEEILDY